MFLLLKLQNRKQEKERKKTCKKQHPSQLIICLCKYLLKQHTKVHIFTIHLVKNEWNIYIGTCILDIVEESCLHIESYKTLKDACKHAKIPSANCYVKTNQMIKVTRFQIAKKGHGVGMLTAATLLLPQNI